MEEKLEKQQPVVNNQNDSDRIAAVRDLIFGESMQQYSSEFADVYDKIKSIKEQSEKNLLEAVANIENKLADLESLLDHKIEDVQEDIEKKNAENDQEKEIRQKLGKSLEKIALMLQE
jgi:hypothetical protein